jgi:hypothetical protein
MIEIDLQNSLSAKMLKQHCRPFFIFWDETGFGAFLFNKKIAFFSILGMYAK